MKHILATAIISLFACFGASNTLAWQEQFLSGDVPKKFQFSSFDIEHKRLVKSFPKKGEYETTNEYETRIATPQSVLYFKTSIKDRNVSYDADSKLLNIKPSSAGRLNRMYPWFDFRKEGDSSYILVKEKNDNSKEYVGSNAFGATRTIYSSEYTYDIISFSDVTSWLTKPDRNPGNILFTGRVYSLKMEADEAKSLRGNLSGLIVCKPKYDSKSQKFAYSTYEIDRATFSDPFEEKKNINVINVELLGLIFYNEKSKIIILSIYSE